MSYIKKEILLEEFNFLEQLARKRVYDTPTNSPAYERYSTQYQERERALSIIKAQPTADVVEIPEGGIGDLSDGYHTFNELYHHRAILFSVICNLMPDKAWKSKLHDTGDMYDGMFIVGIETPEGQATYHYDIDPYWDIFKVKELEKAPKWDGHTPQDAIDRISKIPADVVVMCKDCRHSALTCKDGVLYCFKEHKTVRCEDYCSYGERREK